MSSTAWLPTLLLLVGLGMGQEARAERRVDWSEYLEPAGASPPARAGSSRASRSVAKQSSAKQSSAKQSSAKKSVKARKKAKRPARSKRRR